MFVYNNNFIIFVCRGCKLLLAKYGWWSVRIPEVHFTVFKDNLQNILSINAHFVSVSLVDNVIKGKKT